MEGLAGSHRIARFQNFALDLRSAELRRQGGPAVHLSEQPFRILSMLLERAGDLVTREEIRLRLWPNGTIVEFEHSISAAMNRLRQVLGDSTDNPRYIETLARRGYRWKVSVEWAEPSVAGTPAANDAHATAGHLIGKKVSHYRVLEVLGGGGMGVVYRAEDLRLGRRVALKFLPEELVSDPEALHRFEREARAASALSHPNICTIYEVEEHAGQPFIVMELLEGETLRELIYATSAIPPFPPYELVDLAIQIAEGLEAAHRKGIIHRDIKPANIFITKERQAKILDFGLAKLADISGGLQAGQHKDFIDLTSRGTPMPADAELLVSRTGVAIGTAGYMSPEQVRGEKLDARTDVFSFGLVLYEMATGRRAFAGDTAVALHQAILTGTPAPPHQLNPALPSKIENVINKALQKDIAQRYQSAGMILADLRRLARPGNSVLAAISPGRHPRWQIMLPVILILGLALIGTIWYLHHSEANRVTAQDTLVLADFANSTGDSLFDDTLKPALRLALQQSSFLEIIPEVKIGAILKAMTRPPDAPITPETAREICQRTGSKAYITGAVGALGSEYVLELKAVNCGNGRTLAQEQVIAASKTKVLDALGEAAARLRNQLGESLAKIRESDVPLSEATTSSLDALKEYSLGAKAFAAGGQAAELPHNLRAIQLDPNFALAYLGAGKDYLNAGQSGRAAEYITKAFQLRDHAAERERQEIASVYYLIVTGELNKAAQIYQKTIQSYPRTPTAYSGLALIYAEQGRYEEAAELQRELIQLKPDVGSGYENLALHLLSLQRFGEAREIARAESARKLDTYALHKGLYAMAFLAQDNDGMAEQSTWFANNPTFVDLGLFLQSETEAYAGHLHKARELTAQLVDRNLRVDDKEGVAKLWDNAAMREAMFGNANEAKHAAAEALKLRPDSQRVEIEAALAFAMAGDFPRAESLVRDLNNRFPLHTQVQSLWLPTIEAQLAIAKGKAIAAIDHLQVTGPLELGYTPTHVNISCLYAIYLRGEAYLAVGNGSAAANEFQKILDHNGIVWNCATGALAHLGLARANALQARTDQGVTADAARARASAAYRDFFALWSDADPDIPVLEQAKAEYAKLQ